MSGKNDARTCTQDQSFGRTATAVVGSPDRPAAFVTPPENEPRISKLPPQFTIAPLIDPRQQKYAPRPIRTFPEQDPQQTNVPSSPICAFPDIDPQISSVSLEATHTSFEQDPRIQPDDRPISSTVPTFETAAERTLTCTESPTAVTESPTTDTRPFFASASISVRRSDSPNDIRLLILRCGINRLPMRSPEWCAASHHASGPTPLPLEP